MHALQVYDVVLDAALQTQKCGPRNLLVSGDWEWLLNAFAGNVHEACRLCSHRIVISQLQYMSCDIVVC